MREYFLMTPHIINSRNHCLRLENKETLLMAIPGRPIIGPEIGKRGFPNYLENPRFTLDKRLGRDPFDVEKFYEYWLVSDKAKSVFDRVDPSSFRFFPCDVFLPDGSIGPRYWFCDVYPVLNAIDEQKSNISIRIYRDGSKSYNFNDKFSLRMKEEIVGDHHIFRLTNLGPRVVADDFLMDACKDANLGGIAFLKGN